MPPRAEPRRLADRVEGELATQRRALIDGDWHALAESDRRQEEILAELTQWRVGPEERDLLRRLRRAADRNARLALRLREGVERRFRGATRQATYNRSGRLSTGAASLLDRRG